VTKTPRWSTAYYKQTRAACAEDGWEQLKQYEAILFGAVVIRALPDKVRFHELLLPDAAESRPVREPAARVPLRRVPVRLLERETRFDRHARLPERKQRGRYAGRREPLPRHREQIAGKTGCSPGRVRSASPRGHLKPLGKRPRKKLTSIPRSRTAQVRPRPGEDGFNAVRKDYTDVESSSAVVR